MIQINDMFSAPVLAPRMPPAPGLPAGRGRGWGASGEFILKSLLWKILIRFKILNDIAW